MRLRTCGHGCPETTPGADRHRRRARDPLLRGALRRHAREGEARLREVLVAEPAINFTLNEGDRGATLGAFNHAGIQVASTDDVLAAKQRLVDAGLAAFDEMDTTCCYARQDKIWVHDPDGTPWEVFATHEDSDDFGEHSKAAGADCGCSETGCACATKETASLRCA